VWIKAGWGAELNDSASIYGNNTSVTGYKVGRYFKLSCRDGTSLRSFSEAVLRDESAWYHFVIQNTGEQSTAFINGVKQSNTIKTFPKAGNPVIGSGNFNNMDEGFKGYMAAFYVIDGQALDPTTFGRYNSAGVWVPVDPQGLTYGSNGFKLSFEDPSDLGKDYSGNGNDFTAKGFEVGNQTSPDYDLMQDSPTQNYATINPLIAGPFGISTTAANLADANLQAGTPSAGPTDPTAIPTQSIQGRKYFEINSVSGNSGLTFYLEPEGDNPESTAALENRILNLGAVNPGTASGMDIRNADGTLVSSPTALAAATRILGFDVDTEAGNVRVFLNGVLQDTANGYTGNRVFHTIINGQTAAYEVYFNGGQQPFQYRPNDLTEANDLQTQNMPAAPIPNSRNHFQAITDTGANILTAAQTAFPDGLWWIKDRVNSNQHQLVDSVNTQTATLSCPANTVGAYVAPAGNSVAWCWNWDQANPAANGFNIVQMNNPNPGPGGDAFIIDTGLTNPQFAIWRTTAGGNIFVIHEAFQPGSFELTTNSSVVGYTNTFFVGDGTISLEEATARGDGTMWAWEPVPGYSAFGSYQGNGDADGPLIYTGFSVAWVMVKSTATGNWWILDTVRNPNNPAINGLYANLTNSEDAGFNDDILSNGFKLRETGTSLNASGVEYIYAAFASCPFQAPATAR
jgi:hypothetical protein